MNIITKAGCRLFQTVLRIAIPILPFRSPKVLSSVQDIPTKLSGIRAEDIPQLAAYAHKEANPLYPVPKLMDQGELQRLYYDVMEENQ